MKRIMRYHGFSIRDYLILDNIPISKEISVLEIGIGTGSTADLIIGKVKKYCGVDISADLIDWLKSVYNREDSVKFYALDVCKDKFLGEKFDVVFSGDTLEHAQSPKGYFNFIAKHLSSDGIVLITFPNESEKKHHGLSWFNSKTELLGIIDSSGLRVLNIWQVEKTIYHQLIRKFLWDLPKSIVSRRIDVSPQSFENTAGFAISKSGGVKTNLFACYAGIVTKLATFFPPYNLIEIKENINDKVLLLHLKHKFYKYINGDVIDE